MLHDKKAHISSSSTKKRKLSKFSLVYAQFKAGVIVCDSLPYKLFIYVNQSKSLSKYSLRNYVGYGLFGLNFIHRFIDICWYVIIRKAIRKFECGLHIGGPQVGAPT